MLVYCKNPHGVTYLQDGEITHKIYGRFIHNKPSDIPYDLYKNFTEDLEDATYREDFLRKKTGKPVPEIAFTYSTLKFVPDATLNKLGKAILERFNKKWTRKKKIYNIMQVIRNI